MKKWEKIKSEIVFKCKWLSLTKNDYLINNGQVAKDYYNVERNDFVEIIAVTKDGKIIVNKNYRRGIDDIIWEFPAGFIEKGENPIDTAIRELKEETGYIATRAKMIGKIAPQASWVNFYAHYILVDIVQKGERQLEYDEEIEVYTFFLEEIEDMIQKGEIIDMNLITGIYLYKQYLEQSK